MGSSPVSPGTVFANRFEIMRVAGSGGMGTVYRARDRYTGELVALKLLNSDARGSSELERFTREAQILARLHHPNIVAYVAHGHTPDGQLFLAMEWLEGHDLAARLSQGPLPLRDALLVIKRAAEALVTAHQRGIVHRDLKPQNLFLPAGDIALLKVLDFGIARPLGGSRAMTHTGTLVGTPEYMAPEQARGSTQLLPAVDIFSLGCVLYECLAGEPPFVAEQIAAVLVRVLFEDPTSIAAHRPGVPDAVVSLVGSMLNKNPDQRIADAAALLRRLAELDELEELPQRPTLAAAETLPSPFTEQEQVLISLVMAAVPQPGGLGATQPAGSAQLEVAQQAAILSAVRATGVRAEYLVDGALVVTVLSLGSAQDQAVMATRAARLIKQRWPAAAVVVTTGRGTERGATAVGEVAERALQILDRLADLAAVTPEVVSSSSVLVDDLSARLVGARFALTQSSIGVFLVGEERDLDESRPLLGTPTPCVGRDSELATLLATLTSCIEESETRAVLITAPPGAGKSRLRHEFLRRIQARSEPITVLLGRGDVMAAGTPFAMLRDAIHKLCGLGGCEPLAVRRERLSARVAEQLPGADKDRVVVFIGELCGVPFADEGNPLLQTARHEPKIMQDCLRRALRDWLAAECRSAPVIFVLDDLQWGDQLTVSVIEEALHAQSGTPLVVVAFARPEVHETFPKLWRAHKLQEIPLKGLSKKACERLVYQVLGPKVSLEVVAGAVEQAAGNALFLEELIRSIAEGKSTERTETVLAMLQARIGRLDPGVRRAVRAASVFGETFWQGGVAAILGTKRDSADVEEWLLEAVREELIQPQAASRLAGEKQYCFRHALICSAAQSLLTTSDLTTGHRMAGEFLEACGERDPVIVAEHFELSGDKRRAAGGYRHTAEHGVERGDYLGALHYVERGLLCEPDGELLGQLRSLESLLCMFLNRTERMAEASRVALQQLRAGSLAWCRSVAPAIWAGAASADATEVVELIARVIATEPDAEARTAYVTALAQVHSLWAFSAPAALLRDIVNRIAASVEQAADTNPALRRYLHGCRGRMAAFREPGPWTVVTEYQRDLELCEQVQDTRLSLMIRATLIEWGWLELGDAIGAARRMSALKGEVEQSQNRLLSDFWSAMLAQILCETEDSLALGQAEELVTPVAARTGGAPFLSCFARGVLARVALRQGRVAAAVTQARAVMQLFPSLPIWGAYGASVLLRGLLDSGSAAEATAVAEQVLAAIPILGGLGVGEVELRLASSEAFQAAGNASRARTEMSETLRQMQRRADDITDPYWQQSYLRRNRSCVRAQALAREWNLAPATT